MRRSATGLLVISNAPLLVSIIMHMWFADDRRIVDETKPPRLRSKGRITPICQIIHKQGHAAPHLAFKAAQPKYTHNRLRYGDICRPIRTVLYMQTHPVFSTRSA